MNRTSDLVLGALLGGLAIAGIVLAWCEPEPKSPPDSILASDYVTTLGARP